MKKQLAVKVFTTVFESLASLLFSFRSSRLAYSEAYAVLQTTTHICRLRSACLTTERLLKRCMNKLYLMDAFS